MIDVIISDEEEITNPFYIEKINDAVKATGEFFDLSDNYEVSVTLVDENTIRELNRDYRGVDKITDVLSFPLDYDIDTPIKMLGDIVINLKKIKSQAEEFSHSEERELSYLTVHSMLHLLGYDHIEDEDKKEMRELEETIMGVLDIKR